MTRSDDTRYDRQLQLEDIPNIDLYMDQVIQLFERTFEETSITTRRYPEHRSLYGSSHPTVRADIRGNDT